MKEAVMILFAIVLIIAVSLLSFRCTPLGLRMDIDRLDKRVKILEGKTK